MNNDEWKKLKEIMEAKERAERDIAFVNGIKMDAQQIYGTRYRIRINTVGIKE